jgi:hypothetical protein
MTKFVVSIFCLTPHSSEEELDKQIEEENHDSNQTPKDMEQEIECPHCYDVTTLSSDFDKLLYFCQECHLSLVMK